MSDANRNPRLPYQADGSNNNEVTSEAIRNILESDDPSNLQRNAIIENPAEALRPFFQENYGEHWEVYMDNYDYRYEYLVEQNLSNGQDEHTAKVNASRDAFNEVPKSGDPQDIRMYSEVEWPEELDDYWASRNEAELENEMMDSVMSKMNDNYMFLVRGAQIRCKCGSHIIRLNLPECHGVYLKDKPLIHEEDCVASSTDNGSNCNIVNFGLCSSHRPPSEELVRIVNYTPTDEAGNYLTAVNEGTTEGHPCIPTLSSATWYNTCKHMLIAENNAGSYKQAVTTNSFLYCIHGGMIEPINSGQDPQLSLSYAYYPDCPHEYGTPMYVQWCEQNRRNPYYPGTEAYFDYESGKYNTMGERIKANANAQAERWEEHTQPYDDPYQFDENRHFELADEIRQLEERESDFLSQLDAYYDQMLSEIVWLYGDYDSIPNDVREWMNEVRNDYNSAYDNSYTTNSERGYNNNNVEQDFIQNKTQYGNINDPVNTQEKLRDAYQAMQDES